MKPTAGHRNVSLARMLSKLGYCSRARAEELVVAGRVKVNGRVITNPAHRGSMESDTIEVDGVTPPLKELVYILLNKPEGVVTTRSDERGRKTVYDLLGDIGKWIFPVGRLDKETSGLLLLTNDNRLGERLTNPESKVPKLYRIGLRDEISDDQLHRLSAPMTIEGERLMPARVNKLGGKEIEMQILEGKNRQIRKMCEMAGCEIVSLSRTRIGTLADTGLKPGSWRYLSRAEIASLSHAPSNP